MNLLLKIPSRERPMELMEVLQEILRLRVLPETRVLVSVDDDDDSMKDRVAFTPGMFVDIVPGTRVSKVEAINRDLGRYDWDVVLVLADDMPPIVQGFDKIVLDHMERLFPDGDGELFLSDGRQDKINTIPCMGRKRWESLGRAIYHPSYHAYWCDNEQMERAQADGKLCKVEGPFALHKHSMYGKGNRKSDDLLRTNQKMKSIDKANYIARKAQNWP